MGIVSYLGKYLTPMKIKLYLNIKKESQNVALITYKITFLTVINTEKHFL